MKTILEPTCDVDLWRKMPPGQRLIEQLKATADPVYFWSHAALGNMPPWPAQAQILKDFFTYEGDRRKYSELIFIAGRRGGKTTTAAYISLFEAAKLLMMDNPQEHYKLSANSEIMCINVAPAEPQALDTVFRRAKEIIANSPFFMSFDFDLTYNSVKFPKNITLKALGSSSGSGVGRTAKCFIADEVSSFQDSVNRRGAQEVYGRLAKSTASFKPWNEDIKVAISSPLYQGDFITELHNKAKEEKWPWALTVWEATWNLNPNLSKEVLEEERKKDPLNFDREFGAEAVMEMESFFNPVVIKELENKSGLNSNLFIGEPNPKTRDGFIPELDFNRLNPDPNAVDYFIGTDPAIKNDAFGLCIGHSTVNGEIIIDGATVFMAGRGEEIQTGDIINVIKPLFERLPIRYYLFDIYFHQELRNVALQYHVNVLQRQLNLNDWSFIRNDIDRNMVKLPRGSYLFKELRELLLIRGKKIDHPKSGSKDMADAVCQVISFIRQQEIDLRQEINPLGSFYAATHGDPNGAMVGKLQNSVFKRTSGLQSNYYAAY